MSIIKNIRTENSTNKKSRSIDTSRKPWIPPKLLLIPIMKIANNASGGGDNDAALAVS